MEEQILYVNYIMDGLLTLVQTKLVFETADHNENEDEMKNIHFEINTDHLQIISETHDCMEWAIINLQRALPQNTSIACCQSCRHGNYCPYGDRENEIFCLKHMSPNDKKDVCNFFDKNMHCLDPLRRKLLEYCTDYEPIAHNEYYTYNGWEFNALSE